MTNLSDEHWQIVKMRNALCDKHKCNNCPINDQCLDFHCEKNKKIIHDVYVKEFGTPEWEADWSFDLDVNENDIVQMFD